MVNTVAEVSQVVSFRTEDEVMLEMADCGWTNPLAMVEVEMVHMVLGIHLDFLWGKRKVFRTILLDFGTFGD